jgi:hypothetical protein
MIPRARNVALLSERSAKEERHPAEVQQVMTKKRSACRRCVAVGALWMATVLVACGSDEEPLAPVPAAILGSWSAETVTADGEELVSQGLMLDFIFHSDHYYDIFAQNDDVGLVCEGTSTCQVSGDLAVEGDRIVFDPTDPDPLSLTFSLAGDRLTLSGTVSGHQVVTVLSRSG